jgi:hypothetical protein
MVFLLSSCFDDDNDMNDVNLSNCQITSFSLQNDSIPGLSSVKFTIDQVNGLIFNKDSMPYGTVIDRKVVCEIAYAESTVTPSAVEVYQEATKDSAYWNNTDSLDFSQFVRFIVYSLDGKTYKHYTAQLNIHQQHPDSMTWTLSAGRLPGENIREQKVIASGDYYWMYVQGADGYELYKSPRTDPANWTAKPLTGLSGKTFMLSQMTEYGDILYLPASDGSLYVSVDGAYWSLEKEAPEIKALLGKLDAGEQTNRPSALAAIIKDGDTWLFASMNSDLLWEKGAAVPGVFPITGFGNTSYELMYYQHLMIVAGKDRSGRLSNATWETMDGRSWVRMTAESNSFYEEREGVMLTPYDDRLFMIGGIDASNTAIKDIYLSEDKGVTWHLADSLTVLPEACRARGYGSVLVDEEHFILLFGGKESTNANCLDELWNGRINRLGFRE